MDVKRRHFRLGELLSDAATLIGAISLLLVLVLFSGASEASHYGVNPWIDVVKISTAIAVAVGFVGYCLAPTSRGKRQLWFIAISFLLLTVLPIIAV